MTDQQAGIVSQASLINKTWQLTQYQNTDGVRQPVTPDQANQYSVRLLVADQPDGSNLHSINGAVACNSYDGNYVLENNILNLSNVVTTDAVCDAAPAAAQLFEQMLFNAESINAETSVMVSLENSELVLTSGANEQLVFSSDLTVEFVQINSGDLAFKEDLTFNAPRFQVLRSQAQLDELYYNFLVAPCEACNTLPAPTVDFSVATVVLVAHEIESSGGYDIAITSVQPNEAGLQVNVLKTSPGDDCGVDAAFTGPYRLYRIDGVFDDINFIERTAQSAACE